MPTIRLHASRGLVVPAVPATSAWLIPSLPGYVYAVKDNQVYVNLFLSNRAELKLNEKKVVLEQETGYLERRYSCEGGSGQPAVYDEYPYSGLGARQCTSE